MVEAWAFIGQSDSLPERAINALPSAVIFPPSYAHAARVVHGKRDMQSVLS